ncbi:hypothetical protein, partial [Nodularia sp. UHCC 0506]|uniref:hypothetical protein n=1 Tax=Nodularia sp. UHCC 0506 TaxID=3110243 RepID=UPI002B1FB6E4
LFIKLYRGIRFGCCSLRGVAIFTPRGREQGMKVYGVLYGLRHASYHNSNRSPILKDYINNESRLININPIRFTPIYIVH